MKHHQFTLKKVASIVGATLFGVAIVLAGNAQAASKSSYLRPDKVPAPVDNQVTPARVELGKALFFDPRLSGSNWISCATCHNPALGWSDGLPKGIGHDMKPLGRATPTVLNTAYNAFQMWDGREKTLEHQATGPVQAPVEMAQDMGSLITELSKIPAYKPLFDKAYPGQGITKETIGKAIASFERTVVSGESPFDRWIKGNKKGMSESAQRGFALYEGKARCSVCHSGFNFQDDGFHNIGLNDDDVGRYAIQKIARNKGAFKTPTLRDVALTAPYMHNGAYKTLEEVVEHYNRGGDSKDNLSPNIMPLNLNKQEKADLVAFLNSLTGKQVQVTIPVLPQ